MKTFNRPTALALGAVLLIFGAIGPWISVLGFISGGPSASLEVGLIVFGGIAVTILSAITTRLMRTVSILVGLAVLAEAVHVFFEVRKINDSDMVSPGWGLYLSIVAALFLVISTFIAKATPMQHYNIASVRMTNPADTGEDQPYERTGDR